MPDTSNPTNARLKRSDRPKKTFKRHSYRDAKPYLLEEFDCRCVYSGIHMNAAGGESCLEIDHYDPRKKKEYIQDYYNLLLAIRPCNNSKRSFWPSEKQKSAGLYVINPCAEVDYGKHIFEDPSTNRLWGGTPTGKWHIRKLDLNAEFLIVARRMRSLYFRKLRDPFTSKESFGMLREALNEFSKHAELLIPEWPLKPSPSDYFHE